MRYVAIWELTDDSRQIEGLTEDGKPDPAYAKALGLVQAPLGRRALGGAIDIVCYAILQIPFWVFMFPLMLKWLQGRITWYGFVNHPNFTIALIMAGATVLLSLAYIVVQLAFLGRRGATLGKALAGIRAVNVKRLGAPGIGPAILRTIVLWGSGIVAVGPIVMLLSPLFDGTKRCRGWHDQVGDVWLVDVNEGLDPYDEKRMRIARKTVAAAAEPVAQRKSLPSLTASDEQGAGGYHPVERVSAGVLGVRPKGRGKADSEQAEAQPEPGGARARRSLSTPASGPVTPTPITPSIPESHVAPSQPAPPSAPEPKVAARPAEPATPAPAPTPAPPAAAKTPAAPTPPPPQASAPALSSEDPTRVPAVAAAQPTPAAAPTPAAPRFKLMIDSGQRVLVDGVVLLGRSPVPSKDLAGAQIVEVADTSISKTHLSLRPVEDGIEVTDRKSTNGTIVVHRGNEQRLIAWQPVTAYVGDTIRFGERSALVRRG